MALDKEKANENDLALSTSAEQTGVCIEHQCSKSYLLSMLSDPPEQKFQYSRPIKPSTSHISDRPIQKPLKIESVLMGLSGDGKRVLLLPSNLRNIVQGKPNPIAQETATSSEIKTVKTLQLKRPLENTGSEEGGKIRKEDESEFVSKREKETRMGPRCNCRLSIISKKFHCNDFSDEDRLTLFTDFWKNHDWKQRKTLVCSLIKCGIPNARRRECSDPSRKEFAFQYNLKKNGELLRVCKVMFLTTLSIGDGTVRDWVMSGMSKKPFVNL